MSAVRFAPAEVDLLANGAVREAFPGMAVALDEAAMRGHLGRALLGEAPAGQSIERCERAQSLYTGSGCVIRYELDVRDAQTGELRELLVTGWVFADEAAARHCLDERLAPLARRLRERPEAAALAALAAVIPAAGMAVAVFPVNAELPALIEATDPETVRSLFSGIAPDVRRVAVELGHYGRRDRCVLKYHLIGGAAAGARPPGTLVYGKLAADARGELAAPVITALDAHLRTEDVYRFNLPHCLGRFPDLGLTLFESIPGVPVGGLLKARLKGEPEPPPGQLTLEESITACARIAAALHTAPITLGPRRTLADELAELRRESATVGGLAPELAGWLRSWTERIEALGRQSAPLALRFGHGDFSYTQLISEGTQTGLVDFDTVCQAEPAMDLGHFLAYLHASVRKAREPDPAHGALTEALGERFLEVYASAAGAQIEDPSLLRARVRVYEFVSLLRLALHSWQKFKARRFDYTSALMEERWR